MSKTEPIEITLLRHGEVAGDADVLRGRSDLPLTETGMRQMYAALARLGWDARPPHLIACSPLQRCRAFAEAWGGALQVPVHVLPAFVELDFGDWDGISPHQAAAQDAACYAALRRGEGAPPGGEQIDHFHHRVSTEWHHWLKRGEARQRLLVTHAGVIRVLLMELFGWTMSQALQVALPPAATVRISHLEGHPPYLLGLN